MYTVRIKTLGAVEMKPFFTSIWIVAFMTVIDLDREYPIQRATATASTFQAEIDQDGAIVAQYDNLCGWKFPLLQFATQV